MKLFEYVIYLDDIFGSIFQDYDTYFFKDKVNFFMGHRRASEGLSKSEHWKPITVVPSYPLTLLPQGIGIYDVPMDLLINGEIPYILPSPSEEWQKKKMVRFL